MVHCVGDTVRRSSPMRTGLKRTVAGVEIDDLGSDFHEAKGRVESVNLVIGSSRDRKNKAAGSIGVRVRIDVANY